jgi:hypothetical protein
MRAKRLGPGKCPVTLHHQIALLAAYLQPFFSHPTWMRHFYGFLSPMPKEHSMTLREYSDGFCTGLVIARPTNPWSMTRSDSTNPRHDVSVHRFGTAVAQFLSYFGRRKQCRRITKAVPHRFRRATFRRPARVNQRINLLPRRPKGHRLLSMIPSAVLATMQVPENIRLNNRMESRDPIIDDDQGKRHWLAEPISQGD